MTERPTRVRIATRKSKLALAQTRWVGAELQSHWPGLEIEEVHVVTQGDRIQDVPLSSVGGKGLFVSEVEAAVSDGRADIAVHSMKDVPAVLAAGLVLACVPPREDPRDVLIAPGGPELDALEAGAKIGPSSPRRSAQLRAHRNDLQFALLRGNIDTRLRKLDEGQYAAIVLAYAGLRRLGLAERPLWPIPVEISLPAVGQGALAIEARAGDTAILELLAPLNHADSRVAVEAERTLLARLEGGCQVPLAGHAQVLEDGARVRLDGLVASADGGTILTAGSERYALPTSLEARLAAARETGEEVARELLTQGGAKIIADARELAEREKLDPRKLH